MRSKSCSARFVSVVLVVCVGVAGVAVHGERARACGFAGPTIEELTTFDPGILRGGDALRDGLDYDPFVAGFGGGCVDECAARIMLADWQGYLQDTGVAAADLEKVLKDATAGELEAMSSRLAGKSTPIPAGYEQRSLWTVAPAHKARLRAAFQTLELARSIEPYAGFAEPDPSGVGRQALPAELLATARSRHKAAPDPFLAQRYAFLATRILFYQRDWAQVIAFVDKTPALAGPSQDLWWRARWYLAGALQRSGKRARGNLELARIHAGYPPLSGVAAEEFKPMEEVDWRASLALAKDAREKAVMWRLVGVKTDGIAAVQAIKKLDPTSNLIALLLVRELGRAESRGATFDGTPPDPKEVVAQRKAFAVIEQLAAALATTPGADRPWLMELIAGHVAAKRGDLAAARSHLERAVAARPGDVQVASQAKASLALALALDWKIDPQHEEALATAMNGVDPAFGRLQAVRDDVRGKLAKAYVAAGRIIEAELLKPGSADPLDENGQRVGKGTSPWADVAFIKQLIARTSQTRTEFDRMVLAQTHTRPQLEQELALRYLLDGDFAAAARTFQTTQAEWALLHTDPFVSHVVDCHDCDHEKFDKAPWTHANLATRLYELQLRANTTGETAAQASLEIGNALYNLTWFGNARVVLANTHQATRDTRAAERWYKRAFELTKNRELKAQAAFLAAKAEVGRLLATAGDDASDRPPTAVTWYPVVKRYADTRYYKEVLKECGWYRAWTTHP